MDDTTATDPDPPPTVALDHHGRPRRVGTVVLPNDDALRAAMAQHRVPNALVDAVVARHRESGRFYHADWHLNDTFHRARAAGWSLSRPQALALLFHDAVYVPGAPAGTNESLSALLLRQASFDHNLLREDELEAACAVIQDTAGHRASLADSERVIALDLATLADEPARFDGWTELVWLEYRYLFAGEADPRVTFLKRRLGVLQRLRETTREAPMLPGFHEGFSANLERLGARLAA